jgi:uncharacterized protein (TIGR02145 family)
MKKLTTPSRFASHPFNELKGNLATPSRLSRLSRVTLVTLSAFCLLLSANLQAQVTIGKDEAPKPYSVLELYSQYETGIYGGFRLPQLTTDQRNDLGVTSSDDCKGLMIYNITKNCVETWNGAKWISLCDDSGTGGGGGNDSYNGTGYPPVTDKYTDITVANGGSPKTLRFMTYNLGADPSLTPKQQMQVNGSPENIRVYGGFYQWGRKDAKHTFRGDPTPNPAGDDRFTTALVSNIGYPDAKVLSDPGKFVYVISSNWTTPAENNSDLWGNGQPISTTGNTPKKGANDPCPAGWRVPTQHEWALLGNEGGSMTSTSNDYFNVSGIATLPNSNLYWVKVNNGKANTSFSSGALCGYALYEKTVWEGAAAEYKNGTNALTETGAPMPLLFLPAAGSRSLLGGTVSYVGTYGCYWSSSVTGSIAYYLVFDEDFVGAFYSSTNIASVFSVRCIAE